MTMRVSESPGGSSTPGILPFNVQGVAPYLHAYERYVLWKAVPKENGKIGKPPVGPDGNRISYNDPKNYMPFGKAVRLYNDLAPRGTVSGIGIVLTDIARDTPGHCLITIDLDSVRDEQNRWTPAARDILEQLKHLTYCEWSPSGKGVRIFVMIDGPPLGSDFINRGQSVEFYCGGGRYATVTGQRIESAAADVGQVDRSLLEGLYNKYKTRSSKADNSPPVGIPNHLDEEDVPDYRELNLKPEHVAALDDGDVSAYKDDNSSALLGVASGLYIAGLDDEGVFNVLAHNEWAYGTALRHRNDDNTKALAYLWENICVPARSNRRDTLEEMFGQYADQAREAGLSSGEATKPLSPEERHQKIEKIKSDIKDIHSSGKKIKPETWCEPIYRADLLPSEVNELIDFLVKLGLGQKRSLQHDWKALKDRWDSERKRFEHQQNLKDKFNKRAMIDYEPGNVNNMINQTQQALVDRPGEYPLMVMLPNRDPRVYCTKPTGMHAIDNPDLKPPMTPTLSPYNKAEMMQRIDQSAIFVRRNMKNDRWEPINPPQLIVNGMLSNLAPRAPVVNGLVNHPIVLPDGRCLTSTELDVNSGIYVYAPGWSSDDIPKTPTLKDAKAALNSIQTSMFSEFEFESPAEDLSAATAMLLTGLVRKVLDRAPGFLVNAPIQGSGKTTLVRMVYVLLTGFDMPVAQLTEDRTEFEKALFSMLLEQPEVVCYDNVTDGFTLKSGVLAGVLTSESLKSRILGISKTASPKTNVLFAFTGNNIVLDADLARRIIQIRMDPKEAQPERRQFKHEDVMSHILSARRDLLIAGITVIKAYVAAGSPNVGLRPSGISPMWDRMVRAPIVWAGQPDPAVKIEQNRQTSPEIQGRRALLHALKDAFGIDQVFTATDVIRKIATGSLNMFNQNEQRPAEELRDVIAETHPKALGSSKSAGWMLRDLLNKRIDGLILVSEKGNSRRPRYRVMQY